MRLWSPCGRRSRERPPFARLSPRLSSNQFGVAADIRCMGPRQGKARLRAALAIVACASAWALPATAAQAETATPSPAAQIAHAEFLPYMDPPPGEPATVCLVDTGVDLNPDTASNVVEREALDGGDPGDVWDRKHGTEMAMAMGAPINGWGTVGAWPLVRIVSVRAIAPGATSFPFNAYAKGISACLKRPAVRVINLSFSGPRPSADEIAHLDTYALQARMRDVVIVAGAGNHGGSVEWPAADPNVLGVGATALDQLCGFSAGGPEVAINAPGCNLALADPTSGAPISYAGTSPAAAFASSALAALISYQPSLSSEQVQRLVRGTSSAGRLDVEAAFGAAGLGQQVEIARRRAAEAAQAIRATSESPVNRDSRGTSDTSGEDISPWPTEPGETPDTRRWPRPRVRSRRCTSAGMFLRVSTPGARSGGLIFRVRRPLAEFERTRFRRTTSASAAIEIRGWSRSVLISFRGSGRRDSRAVRVRGCQERL